MASAWLSCKFQILSLDASGLLHRFNSCDVASPTVVEHRQHIKANNNNNNNTSRLTSCIVSDAALRVQAGLSWEPAWRRARLLIITAKGVSASCTTGCSACFLLECCNLFHNKVKLAKFRKCVCSTALSCRTWSCAEHTASHAVWHLGWRRQHP
jgi:hypothetical protein